MPYENKIVHYVQHLFHGTPFPKGVFEILSEDNEHRNPWRVTPMLGSFGFLFVSELRYQVPQIDGTPEERTQFYNPSGTYYHGGRVYSREDIIQNLDYKPIVLAPLGLAGTRQMIQTTDGHWYPFTDRDSVVP